MSEKPKSQLVGLVKEKFDESVIALGGLQDEHVKFITYYITKELGFAKFRFEIKYLETPKRFIIHIFSHDGTAELYCKPKPRDLLDKMRDYMKLDEWKFQFAERDDDQ